MIAGISFVPTALLLGALVLVVVLRSRSTATKIGCEILMLLLIAAELASRGMSPLPMDGGLVHRTPRGGVPWPWSGG